MCDYCAAQVSADGYKQQEAFVDELVKRWNNSDMAQEIMIVKILKLISVVAGNNCVYGHEGRSLDCVADSCKDCWEEAIRKIFKGV